MVNCLPFPGGAFFRESTKVATALSTNDISDNLYLKESSIKNRPTKVNET